MYTYTNLYHTTHIAQHTHEMAHNIIYNCSRRKFRLLFVDKSLIVAIHLSCVCARVLCVVLLALYLFLVANPADRPIDRLKICVPSNMEEDGKNEGEKAKPKSKLPIALLCIASNVEWKFSWNRSQKRCSITGKILIVGQIEINVKKSTKRKECKLNFQTCVRSPMSCCCCSHPLFIALLFTSFRLSLVILFIAIQCISTISLFNIQREIYKTLERRKKMSFRVKYSQLWKLWTML